MVKRAKEAYKKVKNTDFIDVEVHIQADQITKEAAINWWNKVIDQGNIPSVDLKNDGLLKEIIVHCNDGSILLPIPN